LDVKSEAKGGEIRGDAKRSFRSRDGGGKPSVQA